MDRGLNLEALAEEEDEESWDRSDSESGEEGDDGLRNNGEPNQFDNLCDGVLACLALVHASLQELLELKDELLKHSLPPGVLSKSALVTSKVFRSDMHVPVGELIRMVRLYSTPWEEKSTALKKLHDDYEGKKTQLNIAIKRLEFIDAHSKRIARERRVMNWEKLFAKLTAAKGHGRRWKFLIDAFKKHANKGMEEMQVYLDGMESSSGDEEEEEAEEDEEEEMETQMQQVGPGSPSVTQEEEEDDQSSDAESSSDEEEEEDPPKATKASEVRFELNSSAPPKAEEEEKKTVVFKPPCEDRGVWAGEPQLDRELHVRIYKPEGLDCRELKCVLNFGTDMYKTGVLDIITEQEEEEVRIPVLQEDKKPETKTLSTPKRATRGRGLRGNRGGRVSPSKTTTSQMAPLPENEEETLSKETKATRNNKHYEECFFPLEEETSNSTWLPPGEERVKWPQHLRAAINFGPRDEIVAMATIEMEDLLDLELPTVVLPPPVGDVFDVEKAIEEEQERLEKTAKITSPDVAIFEVEKANFHDKEDPGEEDKDDDRETEIKEDEGAVGKVIRPVVDPEVEERINQVVGDLDPVDFPLYSIHSGKSDAVHLPCGSLPLLCYWVLRERPVKLSKMTETESVAALVLDLTGIDLAVTSKEDLHKETRDEALSTISFTPEPPKEEEETVSRSEYDRLMSAHSEEMEMLQNEYEQKLQDLLTTIQNLQDEHLEMQAMAELPQAMTTHQPCPRRSSLGSWTTHQANVAPSSEHYSRQTQEASVPRPPANKQTETEHIPQARPIQIGKPLPKWGKNLSENFFERLQHFEELTAQKKAELRLQLMAEISENTEKKLASQYRLNATTDDGLFDALQDVSLPAVFLPNKSNNMHIYNPRANKYFHPTGAGGARLCQPPSMVQLPPLPKSKMSVLNLFDMSHNFHREGPEWLMQRYLSAAMSAQDTTVQQQHRQGAASHMTHSATSQPISALQHRPDTTSAGSKGRQLSGINPQPPTSATVSASPSRQIPSIQSRLKSRSVTKSGGSSHPHQRAVVTLPGRTPSRTEPTPVDYGPPRSSMTTATPGMLRTPNPVGQSECGILGPVAPPAMVLVAGGPSTL